MLRRYKLSGGSSSTGNALDSMQAPKSGTIKQVIFSVLLDSVTDNSWVKIQLSKVGLNDFAVAAGGGANFTQALAQYFFQSNFVTSGLSQIAGNWAVDCNDKINSGDPLYINQVLSGTATSVIEVVVVIDE